MTLPRVVHDAVERKLGMIESATSVGGGRARGASRVQLSGEVVFVKFDTEAPPHFYSVEAAGLDAIRKEAPEIRVPRVLALEEDVGGPGWIAMEWLAVVSTSNDFAASLGAGLATLHRATAAEWGWELAGYIGPLPQSNRPTRSWPDFWWRERIEPQLLLAREAGYRLEDGWEDLRSALPSLLAPAEAEGPSLLHGDLWNGNALSLRDGPALIDPSCYFGHREVDLAMTELFGGFSLEFYAAYQRSWPLSMGYPIRRSVYQLYYLLVHVNLFGESYVSRTMATLRSALST